MAILPDTWTGVVSCGHEYTADLTKVALDRRAGRVRFLIERGSCSDCFKQRKSTERAAEQRAWVAEQRDQEAAAAEAFETVTGLGPLEGTDKQIAWARRVRHDLLSTGHDALVFAGDLSDADYAALVEDPARKVARAGWWIDQREAEPTDLPVLLAAAVDDPANLAACENDA